MKIKPNHRIGAVPNSFPDSLQPVSRSLYSGVISGFRTGSACTMKGDLRDEKTGGDACFCETINAAHLLSQNRPPHIGWDGGRQNSMKDPLRQEGSGNAAIGEKSICISMKKEHAQGLKIEFEEYMIMLV